MVFKIDIDGNFSNFESEVLKCIVIQQIKHCLFRHIKTGLL